MYIYMIYIEFIILSILLCHFLQDSHTFHLMNHRLMRMPSRYVICYQNNYDICRQLKIVLKLHLGNRNNIKHCKEIRDCVIVSHVTWVDFVTFSAGILCLKHESIVWLNMWSITKVIGHRDLFKNSYICGRYRSLIAFSMQCVPLSGCYWLWYWNNSLLNLLCF